MNRIRTFWGVGLLALAGLAACSSSSSSSPSQQCEALISKICTDLADCAVDGGLVDPSQRSSQLATCSSDAHMNLPCANAVGVSSTYDSCMSMLANPPCAQVDQQVASGTLTLPDACSGAILLKQ
jgi:hypothetical protein